MNLRRPHGDRGRAIRLGVLAAVCAALVGLGTAAAGDGMSYYRTPSELGSDGGVGPGDDVRLSGLVVQGSVVESPEGSTLVMTDGARDVTVRYSSRFPDVVREGENAVVDGTIDSDGGISAETIVLRHSNEYEAPEEDDGATEVGTVDEVRP